MGCLQDDDGDISFLYEYFYQGRDLQELEVELPRNFNYVTDLMIEDGGRFHIGNAHQLRGHCFVFPRAMRHQIAPKHKALTSSGLVEVYECNYSYNTDTGLVEKAIIC